MLAPVGNDAVVTAELLREAGFIASIEPDLRHLTAEIPNGCAAILVAEEVLSPASESMLIETLKTQPSWSDIPIIIVTSRGADPLRLYQRLNLFNSAGVVTLLERPFRPHTLVNAVHVAARSRRKQFEVRDLLIERERILSGLESSVQDRTAELRDANAQLEELVYTISHDLRAPLRAMQGFSTVLLEQFGDSLQEEGRQYAKRIMIAAEKMDAMTLDLLSYGRMARSEVTLRPVALERVWKNALAQCERIIQDTGGKVVIEEPLPTVLAEEPILTQVCSNLLSNALKFVKEGEVPHIRVRSEIENGSARIWVEDNGIGIPPQYKERIFRVFERLDGARYHGTGIGLSIVRKGVERMGGRVGVESEPGKGSRFWIDLPHPFGKQN
ncbi:MAG TPA: HAMP domain-containing sensor histidine kinase [Verrucomicrobiae bacterium]